MELELGLKITRPRDDLTLADIQLAKDRSDPVFLSNETDSMFILTTNLKGFRRERIKIKINEDGTKIVISGDKLVQEMVMMGWIMLKKLVEIKEFKKAFRIPKGVVLDRINAKFDEEKSALIISMPKLVKGFVGVRIEEVNEDAVGRIENNKISQRDHIEETHQNVEEHTVKEKHEATKAEFEELSKKQDTVEIDESEKKKEIEETEEVSEEKADREDRHVILETSPQTPYKEQAEKENDEIIGEEQESGKSRHDDVPERKEELNSKHPNDQNGKDGVNGEEENHEMEGEIQEGENCMRNEGNIEEEKHRSKQKKMCGPLVVGGSAFLVSLIVIVISFVRSKRKEKP